MAFKSHNAMSGESAPSEKDVSTSTAQEAKSGTESMKNTLEVFGKIVIGLVGLCYVLGLIVVTLHLRRYGLNSLDLPQLHYVMAGVWAMLPILLTVLLVVLAIYFFQVDIETTPGATRWKRIWSVLSAVLSVLFIFYMLLGYFGSSLGLTFGWKSWVWIPLLGTLAVFVLAAPVFMFTRSETYSSVGSISLNLGVMVIGILLGLAYLVAFANKTYQSIPWSTGGGRPSRVQLIVDSEAQAYVEAGGIKFSSTANKTDSISLLLTTEKEYVVVNPEGTAVSIPADLIKAVIYEK
jgi:hypothetical protein